MISTGEKTVWYQSQFEMIEKSLNGEASGNLHTLRKVAMDRFNELGFPTTRDEEWRFTNISPLTKISFESPLASRQDGMTWEDIERFAFGTENNLVFINGRFASGLSKSEGIPQGVIAGSLATALKLNPELVHRHLGRSAKFEDNAFVALNTAFIQDGAFISIPDEQSVNDPIYLLFITTAPGPTFVSPRNLILTGRKSRLSIVERYASLAEHQTLTNAVTEIVAGEGAQIEHDKLQDESLSAFHVASLFVTQQRSSTFTSNSVTLGGAIVRNNVSAVLDGEGCECTLNGLSVATGTQLIDNHTLIDHARPHCASHELYKAILDGKAKGVFNGKIFVRKDAQKTDAKQTNKTLLLADDATIDTKPQLEIFADDVKCTHGATVGQLDDEQVFYLRSRGIGEMMARDILTFAFAGDIVERVHVEGLKHQLESLVHRKLDEGRNH